MGYNLDGYNDRDAPRIYFCDVSFVGSKGIWINSCVPGGDKFGVVLLKPWDEQSPNSKKGIARDRYQGSF